MTSFALAPVSTCAFGEVGLVSERCAIISNSFEYDNSASELQPIARSGERDIAIPSLIFLIMDLAVGLTTAEKLLPRQQ